MCMLYILFKFIFYPMYSFASFFRIEMSLESIETRDCLHCSMTICGDGEIINQTQSCQETVLNVIKITIDEEILPDMSIQKTSDLEVLGTEDCVCWSQNLEARGFGRPNNMFGFSTLPNIEGTTNKYRMVDIARRPLVHSPPPQFRLP